MEKSGNIEIGKTPSAYSGKACTRLVHGVPICDDDVPDNEKNASDELPSLPLKSVERFDKEI
jgi:hypothetical protein